jgi:hypothetical protein
VRLSFSKDAETLSFTLNRTEYAKRAKARKRKLENVSRVCSSLCAVFAWSFFVLPSVRLNALAAA